MTGLKMFQVLQKLKQVTFALKDLNKRGFSELQVKDIEAKQRMLTTQTLMHPHGDSDIAEQELETVKAYKETHKMYVELLSQKAKLE